MENVCRLTSSNSDLISTTDLYYSYVTFCTSNNWEPISDKEMLRFYWRLGKSICGEQKNMVPVFIAALVRF